MRFLSADNIFTTSGEPLEHGILIVNDDGTVEDVLSQEQFRRHDTSDDKTERFTGWLCPGFINSHCHLELSYLKNQLSQKTGIAGFISEVITKRFSFDEELMQQSYINAENEMLQNGIVAVGDISNFHHTLAIKQQGRLYYHTFVELLGLNPSDAGNVIDKGNELRALFKTVAHGSSSLAPHAPYSVSPRLFSLLKESCYVEDDPVTIHMQESMEEVEFIYNKSGALAEVFTKLKFDFSQLPEYHARPIKSILPQLPDCNRVLLVHNTITTSEEIQWATTQIKNIYWCLCPNANIYIENRLPDIPSFIAAKAVLTLGTDSLASNHSLSIMDEIKVIQKNFPKISFHEMLRWATINGATFLGIEKQYGSFEKGKKPGVIYINNEMKVSKIF